MFKNKAVNKGVVLLLVVGTITVIAILCSFFLRIMLSQYKLTNHQIRRIQGYYAGLAAMNYALDQLRTGSWQYSVPLSINSCPGPGGCLISNDFGSSITRVKVIFCPANATCPPFIPPCSPPPCPPVAPCNPPPGATFCINSTATYAD